MRGWLVFHLAALGAFASTGCYTRQCETPPPVPFGGGDLLDPDTYETSPLDSPSSPWIDFPPMATIVVIYPDDVKAAVAGRAIKSIDSAVGRSNRPSMGGASFTTASGQLAELSNAGPAGFSATNATCVDYFARFVVTFAERASDAGTIDASAPESGD